MEALATDFEMIERRVFRTLNSIARPLIQLGVGSPCLTPLGLVVLETRSRTTGRTHSTPLWTLRAGHLLVVSTVRTGRSHWLQNLRERPEVAVWLGGRRRPFVASPVESSPLAVAILRPA